MPTEENPFVCKDVSDGPLDPDDSILCCLPAACGGSATVSECINAGGQIISGASACDPIPAGSECCVGRSGTNNPGCLAGSNFGLVETCWCGHCGGIVKATTVGLCCLPNQICLVPVTQCDCENAYEIPGVFYPGVDLTEGDCDICG